MRKRFGGWMASMAPVFWLMMLHSVPAQESLFIEGKDLSIRGQVLDAAGTPIDGVKISNWFPFGSNPQVVYTDARGEFLFPKRNGYVVIAEKTGYAPAYEEFRDLYFNESGPTYPLRLRITLTRGGILEGEVFDEATSQPLTGAEVTVERAAKDPHVGQLPYAIWASPPTPTDAQGRWRVELAPPGRITVRAKKAGYAETVAPPFTLADGQARSVRLSLNPKTTEELAIDKKKAEEQAAIDRSLSGVVTDAAGNPLDAVEISNEYPHGSTPQVTFTDAQGKFQFLRERGYVVTAKKPAYAPLFHEFREEHRQTYARGKKPAPLTLVLRKGGVVEGTILSQSDKKPIPTAEVWLDRWAKDPDVGVNQYIIWTGSPVKANADGRFRIENAPDGTLRLHAKAPGFAENVSPELAVDEGERKDITLELFQGTAVVVRVLDKQTRQPVSGARVTVDAIGDDTTDAGGRCRFPNLAPGEYVLTCRATGYHEVEREGFRVKDASAEVNIQILLLPH